jgi:hypothetical protein
MPTFETKFDREIEQVAAGIIAAWKGWKHYTKQRQHDPIDYAIGASPLAVLEIKGRRGYRSGFDPIISKAKTDEALEIAAAWDVPLFLAWVWADDMIDLLELKPGTRRIIRKNSGRTRQTRANAPNDIEDCYEFRRADMEKISCPGAAFPVQRTR